MSSLTIAGHTFNVEPDPTIIVGTPMDEGHVATLQQTRRENLRNNFAKRVTDAKNGSDELPADKAQALQAELDAYAAQYKFGVRAPGGGARRVADPVEREAHKIARDAIKAAWFAKHGEQLKGEQLAEAVEKLMDAKGEDYMRQARSAIRAREKAASELLDSI